MSVERVATSTQSQYMLSQLMKANTALDTVTTQVSSGKVSSDYTGIGNKTAALEAARAAAARADAYAANTQLAVTQTDLQDTQLTTLSSLAEQLKEAISTAAGNGDGSGLMTTVQDIFEQASSILNSTDSNGNYIYSGGQGNTKPFTATSLSDLTSADVSSYFQNGSTEKSVLVGDGQSVQIGVLASDIGTELMTALKNLVAADNSGSLDGSLTSDQITTLSDDVLPSATTAFTSLNDITAANGETYSRLQDVVTNQKSLSTLYKTFVADIEEVDMTEAAVNLSQAQTALEAALTVTAKLGELSLLNYLPTSS